MEKKLQRIYLTYYNLLIAQDLWQSHNLFHKLSEGIHRIKCKSGHNEKKCEICGIKYNYCSCSLDYTNFKDDLIEYKCLYCSKNYQQMFDEKLKETFFNNIYKPSNHGNNLVYFIVAKRCLYL